MNPLRRPAAAPERLLVDTVAGVYLRRDQWPVYQWVESVLGRAGHDLDLVLAGLPAVSHYGICWWPRQANMADPTGRIGLTIAGMAGREDFASTVEQFLTVLRALCRLRLELVNDPVAATQVVATYEQLRAVVAPRADLDAVRPLLEQEPATWQLNRHTDETGRDDGYVLTGGDRLLRRFTDIVTVDDYLDMVAAVMTPPAAAYAAPPLPATAVHAALDHLDAIWRLHRVAGGQPLLRLASAERTARLADTPAPSMSSPPASPHSSTSSTSSTSPARPSNPRWSGSGRSASSGSMRPAPAASDTPSTSYTGSGTCATASPTAVELRPRRTRPRSTSASTGHRRTRPTPGTRSSDTRSPR